MCSMLNLFDYYLENVVKAHVCVCVLTLYHLTTAFVGFFPSGILSINTILVGDIEKKPHARVRTHTHTRALKAMIINIK